MRVIGGRLGGRRLRAVEGHRTRPTSDRVREALFSRIDARYGLAGSSVLDVFAGTGALAIEAISRGASRAVCIEIERRAIETLKDNVRELDLARQVRVIGDDFRRVLARLRPFDGVFIDPPYGKGLETDALGAVAELGLVRIGGWVSVESSRREQTPEAVEGPSLVLRRVREDAYGDTKLALYEACERDIHRASDATASREAPVENMNGGNAAGVDIDGGNAAGVETNTGGTAAGGAKA